MTATVLPLFTGRLERIPARQPKRCQVCHDTGQVRAFRPGPGTRLVLRIPCPACTDIHPALSGDLL